MAATSWSDVVRELKLPETPETILQASLRLKGTGQLQEALSGLEEVLRRDPCHIAALREAAGMLRQLGRRLEAEVLDRRRSASEADQLFLLCLQHVDDNPDLAGRYLDACASLAPAHAGLTLAEALLNRAPLPERLPDDIVAKLYDQLAARYDWHSRTVWRRRAPELLFRAVLTVAGDELGGIAMADIGCGTGLGAEPFATLVQQIDGVDLSSAMLERAFRRRLHDDSSQPLYAELEVGEQTAWLRQRTDHYDLVLAADALCASSDLDSLFQAAAAALRVDGLFAFSYELSAESSPGLSAKHGYSHNPFAIQRALAAAELQALSHQQETLRYEGHLPVQGGIVVAARRKPA